jgi:uncharacterized protein YbjT (DUF2867 family)
MILVTGATGTVGSQVVRHLQALKAPFRAVYHSQAKLDAAKAAGIDGVIADFLDAAALDRAMNGIRRVFVVSPSVPQLAEYEKSVIDAAHRAKAEHVVLLSLFHADHDLIFSKAHREVEQYTRASGLQWTFLRPNGFMQNMFSAVQSIQYTGQFHFPAGDAKVSHIDASDIGAVAAKVLIEGPATHGGKIYALSGPEALSYGQMAQILTEAVGKPVAYIDVPPDAFKQTLLQYGVPGFIADGIVDLYRHYRSGPGSAEVTPWVEKITGRPATRFADFARGLAAAIRQQ